MFKKLLSVILSLNLLMPVLYAQSPAVGTGESDQQINDFNLAGYGERGKKTWQLAGKNADIFDEIVKLTNVVGNLYGKEEDMKLTSDKGTFNKADGKVHLEDNVVITTTSGSKLTTDSLDWDRKTQVVTTPDRVNIERGNMMTTAIGARGESTLKKVALNKDVRVDINPTEAQKAGDPAAMKDKVLITCDGPLEIDYEKNIAVFNNNVMVERDGSTIYSDRMDVYFKTSSAGVEKPTEKAPAASGDLGGMAGSKLEKIVAKGNVKIVRDANVSYSDEAIYTAADKKIVLNGRPRLVIANTENMSDAPFGN